MVTAGILPFRENSHGRTGNRTRDLIISRQRLTTRPRGPMYAQVISASRFVELCLSVVVAETSSYCNHTHTHTHTYTHTHTHPQPHTHTHTHTSYFLKTSLTTFFFTSLEVHTRHFSCVVVTNRN